MTATNLDTINKEMSASDNNIIARHGLAIRANLRRMGGKSSTVARRSHYSKSGKRLLPLQRPTSPASAGGWRTTCTTGLLTDRQVDTLAPMRSSVRAHALNGPRYRERAPYILTSSTI